jgi:hypothetical protein
MKILTLLVSMMLIGGCAIDTADEVEYDDVDYATDDDGRPGLPGTGGGHWNPCNKTEFVTMQMPDGEEIVIQIPVLCDSRPYFDQGDPPPELVNPIEEVGNPYDDDYEFSGSNPEPKF